MSANPTPSPTTQSPPIQGPIVRIGPLPPAVEQDLGDLVARTQQAAGDVAAGLALAERLGRLLPAPGQGRTLELWSALATIAAQDLTVARVVEPHLDALAILHQADRAVPAGAWGVFAAEGPGAPVRADSDGSAWRLSGVKHWCSLASVLDAALITAHLDDGQRRLFEVDLKHPGVEPQPGSWKARGLTAVESGPIRLTEVPGMPVGAAGWYLERPGFAWGGMGVAAVW